MEFWIIQVILLLIITPLHFGLTFTNPEECQEISGSKSFFLFIEVLIIILTFVCIRILIKACKV